MITFNRLPKGHRFVKQDGYKRNWFHNWAIFRSDGSLLSLGGKTKKQAREIALKSMTAYN